MIDLAIKARCQRRQPTAARPGGPASGHTRNCRPLRCSGRRRCLQIIGAALALAFSGKVLAQSSMASTADVVLDVLLDDETYVVHASARLAADQRLVWSTLTDYERLREFVPGVTRARVLERRGERLTIEQIGVFTVWFVDLPVRLRLLVEHTPYTTIVAKLAADAAARDESTLRRFTGAYRLTPIRLPQGAGVRLDYDASFALERPLPPLIDRLFGVAAVRRTMREQFDAMLREIARRQAALAAAEPAG